MAALVPHPRRPALGCSRDVSRAAASRRAIQGMGCRRRVERDLTEAGIQRRRADRQTGCPAPGHSLRADPDICSRLRPPGLRPITEAACKLKSLGPQRMVRPPAWPRQHQNPRHASAWAGRPWRRPAGCSPTPLQAQVQRYTATSFAQAEASADPSASTAASRRRGGSRGCRSGALGAPGCSTCWASCTRKPMSRSPPILDFAAWSAV